MPTLQLVDLKVVGTSTRIPQLSLFAGKKNIQAVSSQARQKTLSARPSASRLDESQSAKVVLHWPSQQANVVREDKFPDYC